MQCNAFNGEPAVRSLSPGLVTGAQPLTRSLSDTQGSLGYIKRQFCLKCTAVMISNEENPHTKHIYLHVQCWLCLVSTGWALKKIKINTPNKHLSIAIKRLDFQTLKLSF